MSFSPASRSTQMSRQVPKTSRSQLPCFCRSAAIRRWPAADGRLSPAGQGFDFERSQIIVRQGKGQKDHAVPLPRQAAAPPVRSCGWCGNCTSRTYSVATSISTQRRSTHTSAPSGAPACKARSTGSTQGRNRPAAKERCGVSGRFGRSGGPSAPPVTSYQIAWAIGWKSIRVPSAWKNLPCKLCKWKPACHA